MLVVSVHDVSPVTEPQVRWLLGRLDAMGVRRRVLKVIPNQDDAADLRHFPDLVALLRTEVERGSEIVLHGFTHAQEGPLRGRPWDVMRAAIFAAGQAEFASLGGSGMRRRIGVGLQLLHELGLEARGFCAPAWLASPGLTDALREAGVDYAVWLTGIDDLARSRRVRVLPVGYLGSGGLQEALAQVGGLLTLALAGRGPHLRVVLHPQGAETSGHAERALRLAAALAARWPVGTYTELLDA